MINQTDYSSYANLHHPKAKRKVMPLSYIAQLSKPTNDEPRFRCPICSKSYTMSFATFSKRNVNFAESAYHCKICFKQFNLVKM
jgi:transposase-like protein